MKVREGRKVLESWGLRRAKEQDKGVGGEGVKDFFESGEAEQK